MGAVLQSAIIESENIVEDETGVTVVRKYHIHQLSGTNVLVDAMNAGVPVYGDPHPTIGGIYVSKREAIPFLKSRGDAQVIVTWRPPDFTSATGTVVRFACTSTETLTNFNPDGSKIIVKYQNANGTFPDQLGLARTTKIQGLLTYDFIVGSNPTGYFQYMNKVNSDTWWTFPRFSWKMVEVEVSRDLIRPGYRVHLGALVDYPDGHLATCAYKIQNGIVPSGIDDFDPTFVGQKNGYTNVGPLTIAFGGLGLQQTF